MVGEYTKMLPGTEVVTSYGPFWLFKRCFTVTELHGTYQLNAWRTVQGDLYARGLGVDPGPHPAFLDTETTGLAGAAGTLAFLIGLGLWEDEGLTLELLFLRSPEEEAAALEYLRQRLRSASALVTFNGKGFDVPILEMRYLLNRLPADWSARPHLDLLPVARLLWRDHLPARNLGTLETHLLGVQRGVEDIPSWLIPQLYRDYLTYGFGSLLQPVFYHNQMDVLSLVTLLACIGERLDRPEALALSAAEWIGLGRLWARAGARDTARRAWLCALEREEVPEAVATPIWRELAAECKHRGAWSEACTIWQTWAERDPWALDPLIELAKYHEWHSRTLPEAYQLTRQALERARRRPGGAAPYVVAELQRRLQRLEHKLQEGSSPASSHESPE